MKSFSTSSLTTELEREDKLKELQNLLEKQKLMIEKQNQRIIELEETTLNTEVQGNQVKAKLHQETFDEEIKNDESLTEEQVEAYMNDEAKIDNELSAIDHGLDEFIREEVENTDDDEK